jgi:hypothetical protein
VCLCVRVCVCVCANVKGSSACVVLPSVPLGKIPLLLYHPFYLPLAAAYS